MSKSAPLRSILVGIQFTVVLVVLASTGMIYDQLQFLRQKDLGFNRAQIIQLNIDKEEDLPKATTLKEAFKQSPFITSVATSSFLPGMGMGRRPLSADNGASREAQFIHFGSIDYNFLASMDIALVDGRNFSKDYPNDATENILVNETMVKSFGLANPIGEKVRYGDQNNPNFKRIIGVVKDFHQGSLHQSIAPQMFLLAPNNYEILVKIDRDIPAGLAHLKSTWQDLFPNTIFDYRFLDEALQANYEMDQIRGNIFLLFSLITIFITFLGLFGLVAFIAHQRVKEIGVRKVLGASLSNIVLLISKDFINLVLIASLPAFIIAWYLINNWLKDFAYRTPINMLIFGGVLLLTLLFTLGITSLHAIRTGQLNPADTLKDT